MHAQWKLNPVIARMLASLNMSSPSASVCVGAIKLTIDGNGKNLLHSGGANCGKGNPCAMKCSGAMISLSASRSYKYDFCNKRGKYLLSELKCSAV